MKTASVLLLAFLGITLGLCQASAAEGSGAGLDPKKILESLPKELLKDISGNAEQRREAIDAASKKLNEAYREQNGSLTLKARNISKNSGRYNIYGEEDRVRVAGTNFTVHCSINLGESDGAKGAKIKAGDKITATGRVNVNLSGSSKDYTHLHIHIFEAKLK